MLTPPYDFAIVAAPRTAGLGTTTGPNNDTLENSEILYRGSLPAARNAPFMRRLGIRTLICLRKKPLKDDDPLLIWAGKRNIDVKWVKAEKMGEESLGMEKGEVGEVLQILLDPSAYPVYLADVDGNSHTTLVVACLRKMQGWDADSIVEEIYRFEPDHDDLPLVSFITSYLSTSLPSKDDPSAALSLPPPPYPSWLWPSITIPTSNRNASGSSTRSERALSGASASSTTSPGTLPFPNPLTARRHPSMRLSFPAPSPPITSPSPKAAAQRTTALAPLARISTFERRPASPHENISPQTTLDSQRSLQSKVSFSDPTMPVGLITQSPTVIQTAPLQGWSEEMASPENDTALLDDDDEDDIMDEEGDEDDDDQDVCESEDEEFDDDDEEEEEEEEEDEQETVSQYISALDLAGFG